MRQQSESQHQSNSGLTNESFETRKERMDKKRAIRKNKVGPVNEDSSEIRDDKKLLTKEQKMQLQKAKNREAAQRSRDQHKMYVQSLEEENKHLRELLNGPRLCSKCSKEIMSDSGESTDPSLQDFINERHLPTFIQNQKNQENEQFESPFIRMNDYEDSSPLKMFLFVSMIMLGLFLMSSSPDGNHVEDLNPQRDLMEIPLKDQSQLQTDSSQEILKKRFKQIQEIDRFQLRNQIQNSFNMDDSEVQHKIMTEVVPLSYQLSPLSQENCIKSIINSNYSTVSEMKYSWQDKLNKKEPASLRSTLSNQMQVFSPSSKESQNNILFCSLPKLYRKSEEVGSNIFSKFIDIIISGSEMMQIMGKSPNLWMNKIVNFNGIYKVNAQIKEIIQIQDRNCIL